MSRSILFSIDELVGLAEVVLQPYLGEASSVVNNRILIMSLIDVYCYGQTLVGPDPETILRNYNRLPSDAIKEAVDELQTKICLLIGRGFRTIQPSMHYHYELVGSDILMHESPPLRVYQPSPLVEVDESDYVPERLRRSNTS